ncbi:SCP family extracellular subfamily protein [Cardiosporidium cionae]|uniref:SCP family extracellular subfamily protein n=1 Tax=Cardiosporidium cionae TaxID=476202 RepID=A0ABQ7J6H0_9APIC|nr:SCP family extracellular subfamily protein [Cardiosporidium cionae]|eukprot:KAF8819558.1 SCP family extracellular subfamily protein [Cardiosporidium cionae]
MCSVPHSVQSHVQMDNSGHFQVPAFYENEIQATPNFYPLPQTYYPKAVNIANVEAAQSGVLGFIAFGHAISQQMRPLKVQFLNLWRKIISQWRYMISELYSQDNCYCKRDTTGLSACEPRELLLSGYQAPLNTSTLPKARLLQVLGNVQPSGSFDWYPIVNDKVSASPLAVFEGFNSLNTTPAASLPISSPLVQVRDLSSSLPTEAQNPDAMLRTVGGLFNGLLGGSTASAASTTQQQSSLLGNLLGSLLGVVGKSPTTAVPATNNAVGTLDIERLLNALGFGQRFPVQSPYLPVGSYYPPYDPRNLKGYSFPGTPLPVNPGPLGNFPGLSFSGNNPQGTTGVYPPRGTTGIYPNGGTGGYYPPQWTTGGYPTNGYYPPQGTTGGYPTNGYYPPQGTTGGYPTNGYYAPRGGGGVYGTPGAVYPKGGTAGALPAGFLPNVDFSTGKSAAQSSRTLSSVPFSPAYTGSQSYPLPQSILNVGATQQPLSAAETSVVYTILGYVNNLLAKVAKNGSFRSVDSRNNPTMAAPADISAEGLLNFVDQNVNKTTLPKELVTLVDKNNVQTALKKGIELLLTNQNVTQFKTDVLLAHNKYRTLGNLPSVQWDHSLESYSRAHLQRLNGLNECPLQHSSTTERAQYGSFYNLGENLYAIWETNQFPSADKVVQAWFDERNCYRYGPVGAACTLLSTPECTSNKNNPFSLTGHFTQMMWSTLTQIGCDVLKCSKYNGVGEKYMVGCTYGTIGNAGGNTLGEFPFNNVVARQLGLNTVSCA